MGAGHELVFLGTGAACASPTFYCGCEACQEALEQPAEAKTCSSVAIMGSQTTLIDTAPELRLQLTRERIAQVDQVLFTHEHFDHAGGFPQLEYPIRLGQRGPLPVYATQRCLSWIESHFEWMWDSVEPHVVEPFQTIELDGVRYTALPAAHCPDALGYLLQTETRRVAYFPDTGPLPAQVRERLEGVDVLIHDSTFVGRNWYPATHTNVEGTVQLGRELGAKAVYLAHCSMHFDEPHTGAALRAKLAQMESEVKKESGAKAESEEFRVVLPRDGQRLDIG